MYMYIHYILEGLTHLRRWHHNLYAKYSCLQLKHSHEDHDGFKGPANYIAQQVNTGTKITPKYSHIVVKHIQLGAELNTAVKTNTCLQKLYFGYIRCAANLFIWN